MLRSLVIVLLAASAPALAHDQRDTVDALPRGPAKPDFDDVILPAAATNRGSEVTIDEHLGAKIPLDAKFRTSDGNLVSLGDVITGDIPTILTFNYSSCPMLCSLQ